MRSKVEDNHNDLVIMLHFFGQTSAWESGGFAPLFCYLSGILLYSLCHGFIRRHRLVLHEVVLIGIEALAQEEQHVYSPKFLILLRSVRSGM